MALADMTIEQKERQLTAVMILALKQKHRATLLSKAYDGLDEDSPFLKIDPEIYGAYQKAAQDREQFTINSVGVVDTMVDAFDKHEGLHEVALRWGSADCPPGGDEAAAWLLV